MQIGDKALPSISPVGRGQRVKMLITLKPHGIFDQFLQTSHFKTKLSQNILTAAPVFPTMNFGTALTQFILVYTLATLPPPTISKQHTKRFLQNLLQPQHCTSLKSDILCIRILHLRIFTSLVITYTHTGIFTTEISINSYFHIKQFILFF